MGSHDGPLRCVIVDDNDHVLGAAAHLLGRQGIKVVGACNTSAEALGRLDDLRPDVVLVDVDLGEENGFELAQRIHQEIGDPPAVVLVSAHDEQDFADLIADSPAVGFIAKSSLSANAISDVLGR